MLIKEYQELLSAGVVPSNEALNCLTHLQRKVVPGADVSEKSRKGYLPYTLALLLGDMLKVPVVVLTEGVSVWLFCRY